MKATRRRGRLVRRLAVGAVGVLVAVLCLTLIGSVATGGFRPGASADKQVALAAAFRDLDSKSGGVGRNVVDAIGVDDLRLTFRGHAQVDTFLGKTASTKNVAIAVGSCTKCVNFAVALQLILVGPQVGAVNNVAKSVAVSVECVQCTTVAISIVYELVVPHPEEAAEHTRDAMDRINDELDNMSGWSHTPLATVANHLNAVIEQFAALAQQATLTGVTGKAGIRPNATAPRAAAPSHVSVLPGGIQIVPALPGTPSVDIKVAQ